MEAHVSRGIVAGVCEQEKQNMMMGANAQQSGRERGISDQKIGSPA
jgi:hypothetical protein